MKLPSGALTTDYSRNADARGWGAGWPSCSAINGGEGRVVTMARSGTVFAGGVHRIIQPLCNILLNSIERDGYLFHPGWCWGGGCRAIAGTSRPSNHSWLLAFDMDAPENPYTTSPDHTIPDWAFDRLRSYGFGLGADYTGGRRDWMHAEFMGTPGDAEIMTRLAVANGLAGATAGIGTAPGKPSAPSTTPTAPAGDPTSTEDDAMPLFSVKRVNDGPKAGSDYIFNDRTMARVADEAEYGRYLEAGVINVKHNTATEWSARDAAWFGSKVQAWGGHADIHLGPGDSIVYEF